MNWQPTAIPAEAGRGRGRRWLAGGALALALIASGPSAAAQEPWGFEQVTPVEKGSGVVSTSDGFIASPDGSRLLHSSFLPYESEGLEVGASPLFTRYVGSRGGAGWANVALDPPYILRQTPTTTALFTQSTLAVSRNLDYALIATRVPLTPGADPEGGSVYVKNTRTGELRLVLTTRDQDGFNAVLSPQGGTTYTYVSDDGKSALFSFRLYEGTPLVAGAPAPGRGLYSWSEADGLRYEAMVDGAAVTVLNRPAEDQEGPRDAMPRGDDGLAHVYYQIDAGTVSSSPVYVSEGPAGARTSRPVSYSRLVAPPAPATGAIPLAVSAGGRHLLFVTADNVGLVGGEPTLTPSGRHLYRFDAEATDPVDELTYVGAVPSSARVVQMSQDGRTVVFYSTIEQAGSPSGSAHKLFVWREGHGLTYVYAADSGSSGTNTANQLRRLSDNAKYLSFTDNSASLAASFGMANNVSAGCPNILLMPGPCDQVYRYDIEGDVLDCVSCRTDGAAPLGASGTADRPSGAGRATMNSYQPRTVADDGTVFLTSRDALLDEDRNSLDDVYAWNEDEGLRLVSTATPGKRARFLDASSDGSVVFLASRERLAPSDRDDEDDVYATFAGAGFDAAAEGPTVAPCVGGDCRDAVAVPGGLAVVSEDFAGSGNVTSGGGRAGLAVVAPKAVAGRAMVLRVRVPAAGRLVVAGRLVRGARKAVGKARTVRVRVALKPRARRALARRGRVGVRMRVVFAPRSGRRTVRRVRVAFTKPRPGPRQGTGARGGR